MGWFKTLWKKANQKQHRALRRSSEDVNSLKQEYQTDVHLIPLAELYVRFGTTVVGLQGLTGEEADRRLKEEGPNRLTAPPTTPKWVILGEHLFEGFAAMLWLGAALCALAYLLEPSAPDNLYLGCTLVFVVIVSGLFGYLQESQSVDIMASFGKMTPAQCLVMRNGAKVEISAEQLVRGDLVEVKGGDRVPGDIRIVESRGCKVDNSSLTGECEPQARVASGKTSSSPNSPKFSPSSPTPISSPTPSSPSTSSPSSSAAPTRYIEAKNMLFFGTNVVEGWARGVVVDTGDRTVMGRIASLTANLEGVNQATTTKTPATTKQNTSAAAAAAPPTSVAGEIDLFMSRITVYALVSATAIFVVSLALGTRWIECVVFAISIIVANVPEGLMATVTACLTLTARRLAKKNCLVKRLQAVETLGATSTICSDKTGTLTLNRMTVSHLWVAWRMLDVGMFRRGRGNEASASNDTTTTKSSAEQQPSQSKPKQSAFEAAVLVCALCSNAFFKGTPTSPITSPAGPTVAPPYQQQRRSEIVGDASESAILQFVASVLLKRGTTVKQFRDAHRRVAEIPFNSSNKFHISIHRVQRNNTEKNSHHFLLVCKGAPERIVDRCSRYLLDDGASHPMSTAFKSAFEDAYSRLGGRGERVLGLAWLELPSKDFPPEFEFDTSEEPPNFPLADFTFVGLISMVDPPKPGVGEAVGRCRRAGIKVVMVTGDHPTTAAAIARQVGIISSSENSQPVSSSKSNSAQSNPADKLHRVITGSELTRLGEKGLAEAVARHAELVFARTSPQQKLLIVEAFQRRGEVVAVTGDGVNDSPALKAANIGISMGITGSEVSRQTADLVLLDDNFASIVEGIEEGRLIFDNLKKSIGYTLTSNIPEMVPFVLFVLVGIPLPLGTITILCIDVGTDILPAISLAYEPPEADLMQRPPRSPSEHLVTLPLITMAYLKIGVLQMTAGLLAYIAIMAQHGFFWRTLVGSRQSGWLSVHLEDMTDDYGQQWSYAARRRLEHTCQTAFFVTVVTTQWFDLIISKTRRNSLLVQGMRNEVLNFALIFETTLAIFLSYCPAMPQLLQLYPLRLSWWLFGLPFGLYMVAYDELRRWLIRRTPGGFFERELFW